MHGGTANHRLLITSVLLGGCAYQPDSFTHSRDPFPGVYISVDCLDIAMNRRKEIVTANNIVTYSFGNRCDTPAVVDLASAKVYGHTKDGDNIRLLAFDPYREIRLLRLDGRAVGRESIEYPSERSLDSFCIDAGSIAHANQSSWVCFNDKD